ncbi:hypothetical protein PCANC_06432 [Puccinia coronata f. sp. avenae]|uniref:Uncharacterized protein n=1 Tax=Puccinia coronata f. sp. avenae TaxID=200324 RepID=A0A2N5VVS4_9BASI|nr:hypothetical protein PCANC_06432 [Puccinia coronata f. sp. avenae]
MPTLPAKLARMAASKLIADTAIRFKLGRRATKASNSDNINPRSHSTPASKNNNVFAHYEEYALKREAAARPKGACKLPHALPRMPHAYNRRAHGEQACRACTPVWRACKACTPFGQACRLCTPVGSRYRSTLIRVLRYPYNGTGTLIRVPKYPYKGYPYPYKGTRSTLIRVLRTLIAGLTSASRFERLT